MSSAPFTPEQIASVNSGPASSMKTSSVDLNAPAPLPVPPSDTSFTGQIKSAASSGLNEVEQGFKEGNPTNPNSDIGSSVEGPLKILSGASSILTSPLAPVFKPLSDGINALGDKLSNVKSLQDFSTSPAGDKLSRVTQDISDLNNVVGTIIGAKGAGEVAAKVPDILSREATPKITPEAARQTVAEQGVKSLQNMRESAGDYKNDLGSSFREGAANIEKANPNLKLSLSTDQLQALNQLKDNKSFALPEYLKPTATPNNLGEIETQHQLSPTQTQDLITQLNRSTFTDKASGLGVDQSKIGLTNEIKQAASKSFGKGWDKIYGDYAQGSQALDKISDIVNLKKDATPSKLNKNLNSIMNLSSTPEGKIILKNAVNEFKNVSGIDLTNPTESIGKILEADKEFQEAKKGGFFKQNKNFITRRLVIGGGMSLLGIYALGPAIRKALGL